MYTFLVCDESTDAKGVMISGSLEKSVQMTNTAKNIPKMGPAVTWTRCPSPSQMTLVVHVTKGFVNKITAQ